MSFNVIPCTTGGLSAIRSKRSNLDVVLAFLVAAVFLFKIAAANAADTTKPTVTITAPTAGTILPATGSVAVKATASDNVGVAAVQFRVNGSSIGGDTTSPYSMLLNTSNLANGTHVLTAVAYDAAGNQTTSAPVTVTKGSGGSSTPTGGSTPYGGTAKAVPGTIEAENFDLGGEGVAYHDRVAGNAGGQYRTSEHVDIITSSDSIGGGYVVNNFETGEWLVYTISVATAGLYTIELRAASTYTNSRFHVEIDNVNVTGSVYVPHTGGWSSFQWVTKPGIALTPGVHKLKVVSEQQYFNLNQIRIKSSGDATAPVVSLTAPSAGATVSGTVNMTASASDNVGVVGVQFKYNGANLGSEVRTPPYTLAANTTTIPNGTHTLTAVARDAAGNQTTSAPRSITVSNGTAPPPSGTLTLNCEFVSSFSECGFSEQAKVAGRATIVSGGRTGGTAVRLHTEPGDNNVAGSGDGERNDLTMSQAATGCYPGIEQWWAHSILFPSDYVDPPESGVSTWNYGVVFDFHNANPGAGQANFQINAMPATAIASDRPTGLSFSIAYGNQFSPTTYNRPIGPVVRNVWYDFVYHVKWSPGSDGFFTAWVNGVKTMTYTGPTLYPDQGCYLKLANYHSAFGLPSSVIHDRVLRGTSAAAVSLTTLQP